MSPNRSSSSAELKSQGQIVQQVLKENRKFLLDNLESDAVGVADFLFGKGFFTRTEYHLVDDANETENDGEITQSTSILSLTTTTTRRAAKLIDILATKDNEAVDILIEYFDEQAKSKLKENTNTNPPINPTLIRDRLKFSREKFNPKENSEAFNSVTSSTTAIIDSNDFTMTQRSLEKLSKEVIRKSPLAFRNWVSILENMNGLTALDVKQIGHDLQRLKVKTQQREATSHIDFQDNLMEYWNREEDLEWEGIIHNSLLMWKHKNGTNATFFSLVGVFQHSRLFAVADTLMNMKQEIQNCNK